MTEKIQCLIIDDEKIARDILVTYIKSLPNVSLVGTCKNPFEALLILQTQKVDLLFLDIQMPQLTGIEFYKSLQQKPMVVFTTAYPDYAIEGYALDIVDYLLKPIRFERFLEAVNKACRRKQLQQRRLVSRNIPTEHQYLLVKSEHKIHKIDLADIEYIEGMREYVAFHIQKQRILSIMTLKQLESDLPQETFMRIHKSYIIALKSAKTLDGNMLYLNDKKLPIGGSYKQEVVNRIFS